MGEAGSTRPFRLIEIESWPECREVIVEGRVGPETTGELEACLTRALESRHDIVLVDLDRCEALDIEGAKQLLIARQRLSDQHRELLVFGAEGEVREILERVGAFDCRRSAPPSRPDPPHSGDTPFPRGRHRRLSAALSLLGRGPPGPADHC